MFFLSHNNKSITLTEMQKIIFKILTIIVSFRVTFDEKKS